jgi:hypothetical protein
MGALTDALIENKTTSKLTATSDAEQKTENKGIADILGTIFEGITGPMKYAIIASVLVVCIIMIALGAFMLSPAGQNASRTMANAGAKKLGGPF